MSSRWYLEKGLVTSMWLLASTILSYMDRSRASRSREIISHLKQQPHEERLGIWSCSSWSKGGFRGTKQQPTVPTGRSSRRWSWAHRNRAGSQDKKQRKLAETREVYTGYLKKKNASMRTVRQWHRMPGDVLQSLFLEVFNLDQVQPGVASELTRLWAEGWTRDLPRSLPASISLWSCSYPPARSLEISVCLFCILISNKLRDKK